MTYRIRVIRQAQSDKLFCGNRLDSLNKLPQVSFYFDCISCIDSIQVIVYQHLPCFMVDSSFTEGA